MRAPNISEKSHIQFLLKMNASENWKATVCMSDLPDLLHITHKSGGKKKEKKLLFSSSSTKTRALD